MWDTPLVYESRSLLKFRRLKFCVGCLWILPAILSGKPRDADCREFQAQLSQPGIKIRVESERRVLLPGEILNPVIIIENASDRAVDIPVITYTSGVQAYTQKPKAAVTVQNSGACSFKKFSLPKGAAERYPILFLNPFWSGNHVFDGYEGEPAAMESGSHTFYVKFGPFEASANYEVGRVKTLDSACVESKWQHGESNAPDACSMVTLVETNTNYFLVASKRIDSRANFERRIQAEAIGTTASAPYLPGVQIIYQFQNRPHFYKSSFPAITPVREFTVSAGSMSISWEKLSFEYLSNRLHLMELRPIW